MLGDKTWLAVGVHPKSERWGIGQGSVQACQVPPHQTRKTFFFMELAVMLKQETFVVRS